MTYGIETNPDKWVRLPGPGVSVRGRTFSVYADAKGTLGAVMDGTEYISDTMEGLRQYMMAASRRKAVKVSVPFSRLHASIYGDHLSVKHGEATGLHSITGKVLIRWADGKTEQADAYSSSYLMPLSRDEEAEYIRLYKAKRDAAKAYSEFEEAHQLRSGSRSQQTGLFNAVHAAIEAAQQELGEKEKASGV